MGSRLVGWTSENILDFFSQKGDLKVFQINGQVFSKSTLHLAHHFTQFMGTDKDNGPVHRASTSCPDLVFGVFFEV